MLSATDIGKIYETVLSIPGMNDLVKIELRITRKNVLLLSKVIERGLRVGDDKDSATVLSVVQQETLQELSAIPTEFLKKAGLTETNEKLELIAKK